jgi:hypothetical protein
LDILDTAKSGYCEEYEHPARQLNRLFPPKWHAGLAAYGLLLCLAIQVLRSVLPKVPNRLIPYLLYPTLVPEIGHGCLLFALIQLFSGSLQQKKTNDPVGSLALL